MLENNTIELNLIPDLPESTKEEILNPSASLIGQAFRGIAHKVLDPLIRYNIVKDQEMIDFTNKVQNKTGAIPVENRDESTLGLTLKAVEDASYQLNSEKLREMFANLIAATVDNRQNGEILPSFSSILKDLSPDDAKLLSEIPHTGVLPIIAIRLNTSDHNSGITVAENIILFENRIINNPVSVSSLERLGLISLQERISLHTEENKKLYNEFKNNELYKRFEQQLPIDLSGDKLTNISTFEGKLQVTPFGEKFISVVL
ncbi:DUF4393 domain-containing protein [Bacillus wiedmannii]|uniref:DUF4393 domain-containing protein n=1 Tax=Bacillus wiedmannii TaxID=1890302 RepID=UPI0021CF7125|nr:DUF4393 domain-containing protein [Bacillus wiedmannii]MCU5596781.1 DUF4393 domain-containing protein [Bacillus wiedmannii]